MPDNRNFGSCTLAVQEVEVVQIPSAPWARNVRLPLRSGRHDTTSWLKTCTFKLLVNRNGHVQLLKFFVVIHLLLMPHAQMQSSPKLHNCHLVYP